MFASLRVLVLASGVVLAGGLTLLHFARRKKKTLEEREGERRERLDKLGRLIDGAVIDVVELNAGEPNASQLLIYNYDVAGVQYEASQDVTHLRQYVDLHNCRIGVPTSVKYDPQNPTNSIVVSERWTGLHAGTPIVLGIDRMYSGEKRTPPAHQPQAATSNSEIRS